MPAALTAGFPVLIVAAHAEQDTAVSRSVAEIVETLESLGRPVVARTRSTTQRRQSRHRARCLGLGWGLASASDRLEQPYESSARQRARARS
jgi:hypothetical protein